MELRFSDLRQNALLPGGLALSSICTPGHLDPHGMQAALLVGGVVATMWTPSQGAGFALGLLAAATLVFGWAAVPMFAVLAAAVVAEAAMTGRRDRLLGLVIGAATGLAIDRGIFSAPDWGRPVCDAAAVLGCAVAVMAGVTWAIRQQRHRSAQAAPLFIGRP